jgi:hypothetical protein
MAHDLADAERVQWLGVDADRRLARQLQKYPRCRDIVPDRLKYAHAFVERTGRQVRCVRRRRYGAVLGKGQ